MSSADDNKVHSARRICELFRGRFSEEIGLKLLDDLGGELQAVDFVLNESADVVSGYLKENEDYVREMRSDSEKIATLLEKGIEYDICQFACESCSSTWWKKVPVRKMVCKCKRCHTKYDPVPKECQWGWSKFVCQCSNVFHAFGEKGVTKCSCYKCGASVPVSEVLPPRRKIGTRKKSHNVHSCNGVDCPSQTYHDDDYDYANMGPNMAYISRESYGSTHNGHHNTINNVIMQGDRRGSYPSGRSAEGQAVATAAGGDGSYPVERNVTPVCVHPMTTSNKGKKIRTASKKHISTGSTVNTFLSQRSLDTASVALSTIHE